MKTSLTTLSLVLAAGLPVAVLATFAGIPVPASLTAGAFGVFCATLTLATVVGDYARRPGLPLGLGALPGSLAARGPATEERRLAA